VERDLARGRVDAWEIDLAAGQYLYATFDQRGIDVVLHVFGPPGRRPLVEVDRPSEAEGKERVHLVAEAAGRYRIEVNCPDCSRPGQYLARVEALRPATAADRRRAAAERSFYEARGWEGKPPPFRQAVAKFEKALRIFEELGARGRQAEALYRLGKLHQDAHHYGEALDLFQRSAALYGALHDHLFIARAYNRIGAIHAETGELARALPAYRRALAEWRWHPLASGHAETLENLARLREFQGQATEALRLLREAVDVCARRGKPAEEATALTQVAWVYRMAGAWEPALAALERALDLTRGAPAAQRLAPLNEMGQVALDADEPRRALPYLEKALELEAGAGEPEIHATTLADLGIAYRRLGEFERALVADRQSLELFRASGNRRYEANAWVNLGSAYLRLRQPQRAAECFANALRLARATSYRTTEATALLGAAVAARDRQNLGQALTDGEAALERVEALREEASRTDLQRSYLALNVDHYGFLIGVLMQLHSMRPAGGFEVRAFERSEQSRARGLLEDLVTRRAALTRPRAVDQALVAERQRLARQIAAKDRELRAPPGADAQRGRNTAVQVELESLLERSRELADRIRRADPPPAIAGGALPRSIGELAQGLLEQQTVLLEYHLGAPKSYLWAVTADSIASFELPGSDQLDPLLHSTYEQLSRSQPQAGPQAAASPAARLSHILLGQVAERLGERRLLIVADGALQYIPFAALPDPRNAAEPLMVHHEIAYAPSLAVLAELRAIPGGRPPRPGAVAILADPVFGTEDERIRHFQVSPSALDPLLAGLPRLPYSRAEADAIAALAGRQGVLEALGFDASPELVTSGRLRQYRILHFATHGTLRGDRPDLSALALSQVDRAGHPRKGLLYASEIKDQELPADLVVLSGCKTALGKEMGGEGVVGLPQSFLSAGARRVLVSLWDVGDRSTAELMERFYRALLKEKLPPAAALRAAQQAMWRQAPWRAAYHWGGFVLQGDWR